MAAGGTWERPRTFLGLRANEWRFFLAWVAFMALCVWFMVWSLRGEAERMREKRAEFMADCERHEPRYRCTYLWTSMH